MKKRLIYIKPRIVIHKLKLELLQIGAVSLQKEDVVPGEAQVKDDEEDNDYRHAKGFGFIEDD